MSVVKLQSSDMQIFEVEPEVAHCFVTIRSLLENLGREEDDVIPITYIKGNVLKMIIDWTKAHKDDPPAPANESDEEKEARIDAILENEPDLLQVEDKILADLLLAATNLGVRGLIEVACKAVANVIRGKSCEEIRAIFNIQNDLTPAEEEQIRKENALCELD